MLTLKANAKINLALDIISRLENGYHEVSMIMQSVSLGDVLHFEKKDTPGTDIFIENNADKLPEDSDNLISKAADLFFAKNSYVSGIRVKLIKNIPIAAGLAGGSADAAATLLALNSLFGHPFSFNELLEMAVKIGADVPFCMSGGIYTATGIGEKLEPLPNMPTYHICIAVPDALISTPYVYKEYDKMYEKNGFVAHSSSRPDINAIADRVKDNAPISSIIPYMNNALEAVTVQFCPKILILEEIMRKNGALIAQMSGSGPSVFGIFNSKSEAENSANIILQTDDSVRAVVCSSCKKGIIYEVD